MLYENFIEKRLFFEKTNLEIFIKLTHEFMNRYPIASYFKYIMVLIRCRLKLALSAILTIVD